MKSKTYIIKDWSGNMLDFKGSFKLPQFAVEMSFETFEDAWGYLYEKFEHLNEKEFNEQMSEFEVVEKGN